MARQVLTLPDVPATLLTQPAAAATYLPLSGGTLTGDLTRNGADLSNRLIKWQTNGADRWRMGIIDAQAEGAPDTGGDFTFQYVWNDGTAFDLYRIDRNVGALVFNAQNAAVVFEANGTTYPLIVRSRGDTQPALQVQYNGRLEWGTGGAATDTYLNRGGVGALQVGATLFPGNASTNDLGTTASRWRKLWAAAGEFTTVPTVGGVALPTSAGVAALYLPLAGGSLSGNLGVKVTPEAWGTSYPVVRLGQRGAVWADSAGPSLWLSENTYFDGTDRRAIINAAASQVTLANGGLLVGTAPVVAAGAIQTFTTRLTVFPAGDLDSNGPRLALGPAAASSGNGGNLLIRDDTGANRWIMGIPGLGASKDWWLYDLTKGARMQVNGTTGTLTLTPDAGQIALSSGPFSLRTWQGVDANSLLVSATTHIAVDPQANYFLPARTGINCGSGSNSWGTVYAQTGTIQPSSAEMKQDIAPLDPVSCAQAVLDTDWVSFSYRPPAYTEPPDTEDQAPEDRQHRVDEGRAAHAKMLVETQPARDQKGYVLGSPDHQTHDLFGLSDRKSASPSTDLAVVACALQHCLLEIAELKARLA